MKRLLPAAAFLILGAVHAQAPAPSVPSEPALRERVAAVHAAIGANDIQAWYGMTPPPSRG